MRPCRTLLALFALVSAGRAAEIFPLKGDSIKADVVRVSDKEIVYKHSGKEVARPIKEVLKIDYRDVGKPAAGTAYAQVELTDGTLLLASKWSLKKREMELTLLAGPVVKLPLDVVASVLREAHDEKHRRDWKSRLFNMRNREALVLKREDVISSISCTLGEGDETGQQISFAVTLDGETSTQRKLTSLHGLIFKHTLAAKAPPVTCKLLDTLEDVVMAASVSSTPAGLSVTTPAFANIDFTMQQIARLDYSKDRLEYLSDMEPIKVVQKSNLDEDRGDDKPDQWHVYKDTNLNKEPLKVAGVRYSKGLAVKPYVELTYDLKGNFRELSVVVGFDDKVETSGGATIVFERDGKELAVEQISAEDRNRSKALTLNVKDVQRLKIIVKSDDDFDVARHLDLADAKVSK